MPPTYTWARIGTRVVVPYVAPQGRRDNVIGARAPYGPQSRLTYHSRNGKIDSDAFLAFLWCDMTQLPAAPTAVPPRPQRERPCVIELDNSCIHRNALVTEVLPALAGVTFVSLPSYAPELNDIEHLWRHIKHEEMPVRSFEEADALKATVDGVLDGHVAQIAQSTISLCQAA